MKLNRREFLRMLGIGAAGAVLAGVGGTEAGGGEVETSTTAYGGAPNWTTPSHELLSDAHPDAQLLRQFDGLVAIDVVPGSKIKAGDLLAIDGLGSVRPALPGDWPIGFAVADTDTHEVIMACLGLG